MKERYEQIVTIQHTLLGQCEHEVTVRKIGNGYNVRIFANGKLNQEGRCESKADIGYTCRSLLRWEDKCGNISEFASAARERHYKDFV